MIIRVDPKTPKGSYDTNILLSDLNSELPLTSEYKITIIMIDEKEETKVEQATFIIDSIDRFGVVISKFSMEVIPQTNYTLVNDTVLDLRIITENIDN